MCFLQLWFGLSDEGVEDAVCDSRAFSRFMGVGFGLGDRVPDATTLLKFRRIVEENGLAAEILGRVNAVLEAKGVMMRGGSIVDATFVGAPSSTKNASGSRDPEMRQGKKGKSWHFGMKAHIGVDAGSGLVRTAALAPANVSDVAMACALARPDDGFCYADSGYTGVAKRPEVAGDPALAEVEWVVAEKPSRIKGMRGLAWEHSIESRKASVRSKVEHPFLVVKRQFGCARCRYRGLAKNASMLTVVFAQRWPTLRCGAGRDAPSCRRARRRRRSHARLRQGRPRSEPRWTDAAEPPHGGRESRKNSGETHRRDRTSVNQRFLRAAH